MKKIFLTICFLVLIPSLMLISESTSEKSLRIAKESIIADTHEDVPTKIFEGTDIGVTSEKSQIDIQKMKSGGLNAPVFAIWISNKKDNDNPEVYAMKVFASTLDAIKKYQASLQIAYSAKDIRDITSKGKIAVTLSLENSPVFHSPSYVDLFYGMGVRMASLTHWNTNFLSDSATDKPKWKGISPLGEKIIKRMNDLGMMIDVSHLADESVKDILSVSKAPIIASHSCAKSLSGHPRNLNDDLIKEIASKGGLIDINFATFYLKADLFKKMGTLRKEFNQKRKKIDEKFKGKSKDDPAYLKELKKIREDMQSKFNKFKKPKLDAIVKHILYIKNLVGINHVGIGSDFEGIGDNTPIGMEDASKFPALIEVMLKAGLTEKEVKKVLGENFLNFYEKVEIKKDLK